MSKFFERFMPIRAVVSPLSAFFAGTLLTCAGYALLTSYLSLKMNTFGVSTSQIGVILSMYYVGYILAALSASKIINKVGHIRSFSAFISLFSALVLAHIFSQSPILWGGLRFCEGYCIGAAMMCLESWLNARANNKNRGLVMSLYMVTTYMGSGLGQLLLNVPDTNGILILALVSIIFSLALIPISLTALPMPEISVQKGMKLLTLYKISPVGVVGCFCSGIFVGAFYTLGTIYAVRSGLDLHQTSLFMFSGILGGMCVQIPVGKLSDLVDRRFVILWACVLMFFIAPWIHIFIDNGTLALTSSAFVLGCCTFVVYPICVSHVNDLIQNDDRVPASGLLIMLQSLGMVIGPIIIAAVMQLFGAIAFLICLSVSAAAFVFFAFNHIALRDIKYINVTPTTPQPTAPTPVFPTIAEPDSVVDKTKSLFVDKKH